MSMQTPPDADQICEPSAMQQGLFFNSLLAPGSGVDMVQFVFDMPEEVDPALIHEAWQRAADRHPILRARIDGSGGGTPSLVMRAGVRVPCAEHDWRSLDSGVREGRLQAFLLEDRERGVDFGAAPLLRLNLFRMEDSHWRLVWTWHHALLDGHSVFLLVSEVFALYEALRAGTELPPSHAPPFGAYIAWARAQDGAGAESYWRGLLAGFTEPTPLPLDRSSNLPFLAENYREQLTSLDAGATLALRALAREHGLTPNTVVQGAWALVLARYAGTDDVVFGNIRSGRRSSLPSAPLIVGPLIYNVPVRVRVSGAEGLIPWLQALRTQHMAVRDHEHSPLLDIQSWSEVPKGTPLFESGIVFDNSSLQARFRGLGGAWERRSVRIVRQPSFPLTVAGYFDAHDRLCLRLGYYTDRLEHHTMEAMLGRLKRLLEQMVAEPGRRLGELEMMGEEERALVLHGWNRTETAYPPERTVHELVSAQARRTPGAAAVEDASGSLTYAELEARSDRLAHLLRARGVRKETRVGVLLERGTELVVSLLAVLKAGGCYVPLDTELPGERLRHLLRDSGARLVVTRSGPADRLRGGDWTLLRLDEEEAALSAAPAGPPAVAVGPRNLAYLIYTSGSTGTPRGVLVEHRGVVNVAHAERHLAPRRPGRVLQAMSVSFDASLFELLLALANGSTVVAPPAEARAGEALGRFLARARITAATLPPSVLRSVPPAELPELRTVCVGGEVCSRALAEQWAAGRRFWDVYGPTEASIWVTAARVRPGEDGAVPIGRPIANTRCYVLDAEARPVPVGVWGELYLGGGGVARGYHGRPALTAERFGPDPFSGGAGARLYRTGDRARWRGDGVLEFGGRLDGQVKVRGHRIEPGEVEHALRTFAGVRDAVVVVRADGGEDRLVGYVAGSALDVPRLRSYLQDRLPPYMVPSAIVVLDALPLSSSGKVDRRALPAPSYEAMHDGYAAPRTATEEALAGIWADVLGLERVGVHDNFFDLGGHSLLALQIINRIGEALERDLPIHALFRSPTVAQLSAEADAAPRSLGAGGPPGFAISSRDAFKVELPARPERFPAP